MSSDQPPAPSGGGPYRGGPYGGPPPGGPFGEETPYGSGSPYGKDPSGGYGAPDPRLRGMPPLGRSWRRLAARVIDAIIVGIPVGVLLSVAGLVHWSSGNGDDAFTADISASALSATIYFVYEGLMLAGGGRTLGKMAMKIRVAMLKDGAPPVRQAAWVRAAVYSLPGIVPCLGTIFWLINVLWHLGDRPFRQCLHDKAAQTVVVSTQQQAATGAGSAR
jgi:uncharacterized RDD family membrane protein YckC